MEIFFESTAGSCGVCTESASSSCSVCRLGLALAEMQVVLVGGQRLGEIRRRIRVDDEMVMARVVGLDAGGRDAHALEAEDDGDRAFDLRAILGRDDVDLRADGRGFARIRDAGQGQQRGGERSEDPMSHESLLA